MYLDLTYLVFFKFRNSLVQFLNLQHVKIEYHLQSFVD